MLISFEVENFLSIKDRQELNMTATSDKEVEDTHCIKPGTEPGLKLLKSAGIYGANASGKSNIINAIQFMRHFVITSASGEKIKEGIQFQPFKLDGESLDKPGLFEMKFVKDREIYVYGFKVDNKKVLNEWLYFYPHKNKALLFERIIDNGNITKTTGNTSTEITYHYKFGSYFKGEKHKIKSLTRSNALYLTVGAQFAHPILEKVFGWFSDFLKPGIVPGVKRDSRFTTTFMEENRAIKRRIIGFLKSADLGIEDVKIEKSKIEMEDENGVDIKMIHRAAAGDKEVTADIDFDNESMGTQRMYQLAGPLFDTLVNGGVLVIDELEESMHFHMLKALLTEFFGHSGRGQIIFTTHNVQLLEERILRRDEIWFTEKRADGGTELFSLSDFKPKPRKDKSLKNGYLNGAFGAVPILGDLLSE